MNILFIHQAFPGQYRHIIKALASQCQHRIVGMGINELTEIIPSSVTYVRYPILRGNIENIPDLLSDFDTKTIRGESCAEAAFNLKQQGFNPDIICAHPGWGEALFINDIWPNSPLLCYQEFFYNSIGFDSDFDAEFQNCESWRNTAKLVSKNANPLLSLNASDWNITPTKFQRSTFPYAYHPKFSVIHDGIDTNIAKPNKDLNTIKLECGIELNRSQKLITFVNRSLEPYRGCHTFIRAIPLLLEQNPSSKIIIVGKQMGVSYGSPAPTNSWKSTFLAEIDGSYDPKRVVFTDWLIYSDFIRLLQLSSCHVYLTYPFVLSWSLLEAMSIGVPIVASDTAPVSEIITNGTNGLLVDFFNPEEMAASVNLILNDNKLASELTINAKYLIDSKYSLDKCIPSHLALIQLLATKSF